MNEFYDDCSRDGHPKSYANMCRCGAALYRQDGSRHVNHALIGAWADGLRRQVADVLAGRDPNGPAVLDAAPSPSEESGE